MRGMIRTALALVLMSTWTSGTNAASLRVSPAQFILHDVQPGKVYDIYADTALRLTVYNDDESSRTWTFSAHRPSERGQWERGYGEIPDAQWLWFGQPEITILPDSKSYGHFFLRIPDEEQYYNQHWVVTLSVQGKSGAASIGLAVNIRAQIETTSDVNVSGRPYGLLGMKPSALLFEDVKPGVTARSEVLLYNNDVKAHSYKISSLLADQEIDKKKYLKHDFEAIPNSGWIRTDTEIRIEAGKFAVLEVAVEIPRDAALEGAKWEELLLIQPDEGRAEFVRVQVLTAQKEANE